MSDQNIVLDFVENVACSNVSGTVPSMGKCFQEVMFLGETAFATLFIYLIFGVIFYKSNLPPMISVPMFLMLSIGILLMNPYNPVAYGGLIISIIAIGTWIGLGYKERTLGE